ncbi:hypothetical protein D9M73_273880 [compost metagenome]
MLMSTTRSRITGKPGSGRMTMSTSPRSGLIGCPDGSSPPLSKVETLVMQARQLAPLMFMPSEPQTPSRQLRR